MQYGYIQYGRSRVVDKSVSLAATANKLQPLLEVIAKYPRMLKGSIRWYKRKGIAASEAGCHGKGMCWLECCNCNTHTGVLLWCRLGADWKNLL